VRKTLAIALVWFCAGPAAPPPLAMVTFEGECDASGAVFVGSELMVVDDEDSHFRFYNPAQGGEAKRVAEIPTSTLQFDPKEPELDLEAITPAGDSLFWVIGSHSRNDKMQPRWSRQNLFAFHLRNGAVEPAMTLTGLIPALGIHLRASGIKNIDAELSPKAGGLSIEGMAAMPSGDLLIGLRSPLAGGNAAIVVRLSKPAEAAKSNHAWQFIDQVFLLPLDGAGVRDLVFDAARSRYLILSGPVGPGNPFKIWQWKGTAEKPALVRDLTPQIPKGTSAETLVPTANAGEWWVLLDEGARKTGSVECKDAPANRKSFHGFLITGL
jgi:hypothetical protein